MWFEKAFLLLRLRCGRRVEEMEVVFLQYMVEVAFLDLAEETLGFIC